MTTFSQFIENTSTAEIMVQPVIQKVEFNLQRFAKDGPTGQRTEQATPRKRSKAREDGQVAKSMDLNTVMVLICGFGGMYLFGLFMVEEIMQYSTNIFQQITELKVNDVSAFQLCTDAAYHWMLISMPVIAMVTIGALAVNIMQVGLVFTSKPIMFDPSKLNPISGFKRIFSLNSINELVKSIFKMACIIYLPYRFLYNDLASFPSLIHLTPVDSFLTICNMCFDLCLQIIAILFILALIDYTYQKWQHNQQLMMSKYDIKQEFKMMEGDPKIKMAIRRKMMEMSRRSLAQEVPKADVIITNPTHYSVALRYNQEQGDNAPLCVAKGTGAIALRIRELAKENGVYIYEAPPLARALFAQVDVGDQIPEELFVAVAEILGHVFGRRQAKRRA